jgi:predicted nucleic acid-binding protein
MRRIYLDNCCLGRAMDDQTQDRIRFETEAVYAIMRRVRRHEVVWIGSDVVELENEAQADVERRSKVTTLLKWLDEKVSLSESDFRRAHELRIAGFKEFDAYHLAAAESAHCDVFLTTDDRLIKRARRLSKIKVAVKNPVDWVLEELAR